MRYIDALERAIDSGIIAAKSDYTRPDQREKLSGSIAGFEACRGKAASELLELLESCKIATMDARRNESPKYWWYRCYELEVEWICNVMSAILHNEGLPTIITPTARGVMAAAKIIGVRGK